jgi:hypothetical protein
MGDGRSSAMAVEAQPARLTETERRDGEGFNLDLGWPVTVLYTAQPY